MTQTPSINDDQSVVIDFLSRSASYGPATGPVERIETHCSVVFLVGDRAYKLKRAIRYSSLDYTTLALRQTACENELVLNRRAAPELYLGVQAINRDDSGRPVLDGPGAPLDYVVVMRRFDQADLLDSMADAGKLTYALMHELGEAVAHLHLAAEVTPTFGGSAAIRRVIEHNSQELAKVAGELGDVSVGMLSRNALVALERLAPLLDQRRAEGRVRRCHGDLRLANICLFAGHPTLFDCIEFSEEISCIDTLYDLAFLLMDLQLRGRRDLSDAVTDAYLGLVPETEGLRALPLFLALRAATRSYALAGAASRQNDPRRLIAARRHIEAGIGFLERLDVDQCTDRQKGYQEP